jgi:hypothetical protein
MGSGETELAVPEREVVRTVTDFAPLWDELFPAEQARIVRLLVERVDLSPTACKCGSGPKVCIRWSRSSVCVRKQRRRELPDQRSGRLYMV